MLNIENYKTEYISHNSDIIITTDHFSLPATLDCGQAFRFSCNEKSVWTGVALGRKIEMEQKANKIIIYNICEQEFLDKFYDYFGLNINYPALLQSFEKDTVLKQAINYCNGIRVLNQDKWETICSFIFSQNNNIKRIKGIIERFCALFGEEIENNVFDFPKLQTIAALEPTDLEAVRAGFRAKYIIDAAKKISSGEVILENIENMPINDARNLLMKIKGIGPKVAECVLLFSCRKYDAFPIDVWMKRVMATYYPQGLPQQLTQYGGIAQQYLFHYARSIQLH